jgi:glycosyltransferase involved in cell wall biosynthesis
MGGWFALRPWQYGFFRHQVTRSIAITDTVRRELLHDPRVMPLSQMEIIIPGVDPEAYRPGVVTGDKVRAQIGIGPEVPLVSLIGRFQHVKGQHIFIEMARLVLEKAPETHFALAGDNVFGVAADEAYKAQIIALVDADPRLRERVHFLGFWPDSREVVAASTIIACTSYAESLGMVVIEAMSMGAVVVSTRGGGPSETVVDGETGFLAEPGAPPAFAEKVLQLLQDPNLRARIGAQARAHVLANLSIARYADRFEQVAHALVAAGRTGSGSPP